MQKAYRASLLRFADDGTALYESDGLLVTGQNPASSAEAARVLLSRFDHPAR